MNTKNEVVSDDKQGASGTTESTSSSTDTVKYESYKKAVSQKKAAEARAKEVEEELNRIKAEKEAEEENKLKEQNEFKELYEQAQSKLKEAEDKHNQLESSIVTQKKKDLLMRELGRVKRPEYLEFAALDQIDLSDPESVKKVAESFRENHSDLIEPTKTTSPQSGDPKDNSSSQGKNPLDEAKTTEDILQHLNL